MWDRTVGSLGFQPGQFNEPRSLALTPDEAFLLVADAANQRVVVLRATDGAWVCQLTGPPGTLQNSIGVSVVPSTGQVLVSDYGRDQVIQFQSSEDDSVVGTLGTGQGSGPTQFQSPLGLAVLEGPCCPAVRFCFNVESESILTFNTIYTLAISFFFAGGPHASGG